MNWRYTDSRHDTCDVCGFIGSTHITPITLETTFDVHLSSEFDDATRVFCPHHGAAEHIGFILYYCEVQSQRYDWKWLLHPQDMEGLNIRRSDGSISRNATICDRFPLCFGWLDGAWLTKLKWREENGYAFKTVRLMDLIPINEERDDLCEMSNSLDASPPVRITFSLPEISIIPRRDRCRRCRRFVSAGERLPMSVLMAFMCAISRQNAVATPISVLNIDLLRLILEIFGERCTRCML